MRREGEEFLLFTFERLKIKKRKKSGKKGKHLVEAIKLLPPPSSLPSPLNFLFSLSFKPGMKDKGTPGRRKKGREVSSETS